MKTLKPQTTVKIYQRPLTGEEFEGEAKVLKVGRDHGDGLIMCEVRFLSDGFEATRLVNPENA